MSHYAECHCGPIGRPDCEVMRELRQLSTAEGRRQAREEYYALLRQRAGLQEKRATPGEAWHYAQKAGVPMDALVRLRGEVEARPALQAARDFCSPAAKDALFLLLLGPTRCGKTTAAAHVVVDFCRSWPWNSGPSGARLLEPVVCVPASTLTHMSAYAREDTQYLEKLHAARLLVLEDVGDESTDIGKGEFVDLVMRRDAKRLRTVITSNLPREAFKKRYGDAVSARIREHGMVPELARRAA